MATPTSQPGRGRIPAPVAEDDAPVRIVSDIRAGAPFLLTRAQLLVAARRLASITALVCVDLGGLVLGLYAALVARELYYGREPVLWGVLWRIETDWLPFLTLITVLVFSQAHLYEERERRPGFGRVLSSLILVALITLAFAIGTGHQFSTYGLAPAAVILCAATIAVLRTSYEFVTGEVLRQLGVRRYALLAGSGENVARLRAALGSGRSGIDYEFVGAVAPSPVGVGLPVLGDVHDLPALLDRERVDELIVTDSDFGERELLEIVDHAHRRGVEVRIAPKATELLTSRAEFVMRAGQASPAKANRRHAEVASVLLHENVGCGLRGSEQAVHRPVDPHRLVDPIPVGGVGVIPTRFELHELELVRRVTVDLVGREEDERRIRARAPGALEEVQCPDRVDLEVVEGSRRGQVVRGLGRAVDDQVRRGPRRQGRGSRRGHECRGRGVQTCRRRSHQPLEVPRRVPRLAEEVAAHVVVDANHAETARVEEGDGLRADQAAGTGDECALHCICDEP